VTNAEVYWDSCKSIVDGVIQGFNGKHLTYWYMINYKGTIFAYGQTTSGKTHTMLGSQQNRGLL
jgi:type IV secretory pathway ATPase VirB11/archaellum biosynthesis ATPase